MTDITILSGFLGVGKTTFANKLIDYFIRRGDKTAYVVNEFGQAGLDASLLRQKGFQTVDVFGGCICCTLRGKIIEALREVIGQYDPGRIVFEPSGIFVFEKFREVLEDPFLKERCRVDNVVTIVDSTHVTEAMFVPGNFFANQVAHADTLLLSKLEVFDGDLAALTERLGGLNRSADLIARPWSEMTDQDLAMLIRGGSTGVDNDDKHHSGHAHMDSVTIAPRALDEPALSALRELLAVERFGKVYRIKGVVEVAGERRLLQASFDSLRLEGTPPMDSEGLTFIGEHLDKAAIREHWEQT